MMDLRTAAGREWDVVVVGTGMGGSTFGWAMAEAGRSVLFLERGRNLLPQEGIRGQYAEMAALEQERPLAELLPDAGRWDRYLEDGSRKRPRRFVPFVGMGTGGSTGLYGAALERLFPEDFEPGLYHERGDSSLPRRWPVSYEEFRPWYRRAESLYGLAGDADPLRSGALDPLLPSPPLDPVNRRIAGHLADRGLHPYRLPVACSRGEACRECQGFLCAAGGKGDSATVCLRPALSRANAELVSGCTVERLEADRRRVHGVVCRDASGTATVRGHVVVLAAGALQTPLLLLRSASRAWPEGLANASGQVGRNLMRHAIDLYLVTPPVPVEGYRKRLAWNDHYLGPEGKLGSVQSFGRLPPLPVMLQELENDARQWSPLLGLLFLPGRPLLRRVLARMTGNRAVFAGILEDLPYPQNRVEPLDGGGARLVYRLGQGDRERLRRFRRMVEGDFRPWPVTRLSQAENNARIAHVCGTCRFGEDPATSVLDPWNRAHGLDNLYVVDASFFPSSGGINPALTIAANALRVAHHLCEQGDSAP